MTDYDYWHTIAADAIDGRSAYQHADELAELLTRLDNTYEPTTVLEIGGGNGGSAWAWSQLHTVTEVITITLPDPGRKWLCCPMAALHTVILGDSTHGDTVHQLTAHLAGRRPEFVFIDGDHSYATALSDFATYGPMVTDDGLIALHDILPESRFVGFEVDRLWAQIPVGRKMCELIGDADGGMGTGLVLPATRADWARQAIQPLQDAVAAVRDMPAGKLDDRVARAAALTQQINQRVEGSEVK